MGRPRSLLQRATALALALVMIAPTCTPAGAQVVDLEQYLASAGLCGYARAPGGIDVAAVVAEGAGVFEAPALVEPAPPETARYAIGEAAGGVRVYVASNGLALACLAGGAEREPAAKAFHTAAAEPALLRTAIDRALLRGAGIARPDVRYHDRDFPSAPNLLAVSAGNENVKGRFRLTVPAGAAIDEAGLTWHGFEAPLITRDCECFVDGREIAGMVEGACANYAGLPAELLEVGPHEVDCDLGVTLVLVLDLAAGAPTFEGPVRSSGASPWMLRCPSGAPGCASWLVLLPHLQR